MRVRADRHAALGWLGIDSYRPSGRVSRPTRAASTGMPAVEAEAMPTEVPAESSVPAEAVDDRPAATPVQSPPAADHHETAAPVAAVTLEPTPRDEPGPDMPAPTEGVIVARGSMHAALAEAIAGWAGLPCRAPSRDDAGPAGDTEEVVIVGGRRWPLAEIAADATAKRRLWKALATRSPRTGRPGT